MSSSTPPENGNVIPMRAPSPAVARDFGREQAALFIGQISAELEQLATTTGMELVSYFLAMARSEANAYLRKGAATPRPSNSQAPYRAD